MSTNDVADDDDFQLDPVTVRRRGRASQRGNFSSIFTSAPTIPIEETVSENGNTPWEMTLYQSQNLTDRNGRIPEEVVAQRIIDSFRDNGQDIRLVRGLPLVDAEDDVLNNACPNGPDDRRVLTVMQEYIKNDAPIVAADSNILLADTPSGGCAGVNGNIGTSSARNINERRPDTYGGSGPWFSHVQAAMHEANHNMGFGHCASGNIWVHGGYAQNNDGFWEKTPEVACNDTYNKCGEYIPPRFNDPNFFLLHYHDCTFEWMSIDQKPTIRDGYDTTIDNCDYSPKRVERCEGDFTLTVEVQFTNTGLIPVTTTWRADVESVGYVPSEIVLEGGQTRKDSVEITVPNDDPDCLEAGSLSVDVEITDELALSVE